MYRNTTRTGAAIAALGLALTGCTAVDRAGGQAADEQVTLTFAQPNGGRPDQLTAFADAVDKATKGTLKIQFEDRWRAGEPNYEVDTIKDVQAGKADLAWVGARAFDRVGVNSFQALLAPLLIDSHDLQAKVFEAGIPTEMLTSLEKLDLVGVGVLPGPLRKLLSKGDPLTTPASVKGKRVGIQASAVADQTFAALGATTVDLPSLADISDVDAIEQQLSSVWASQYQGQGGTSVVGNLNLWPRPLVIFMGRAAYDKLSAARREVLRQAAATAVTPALQASRDEDGGAVGLVCKDGLALPAASEADLAAFRAAVAPVHDAIATDPQGATWLKRIQDLKTQTAVPPDTAACPEASAAPMASPLDGRYSNRLTGTEACNGDGPASYELEFAGGWTTIWVTPDGGNREVGFYAAFQVLQDQLTLPGPNGESMTMTWKLDGDNLFLTDLRGGPCGDATIWTTNPWTRMP